MLGGGLTIRQERNVELQIVGKRIVSPLGKPPEVFNVDGGRANHHGENGNNLLQANRNFFVRSARRQSAEKVNGSRGGNDRDGVARGRGKNLALADGHGQWRQHKNRRADQNQRQRVKPCFVEKFFHHAAIQEREFMI